MNWQPKAKPQQQQQDEDDIKLDARVSLVGRPASGKSLLIGSLLRQARNSVHSFTERQPTFYPLPFRQGGRNDVEELVTLADAFVQGRPLPATNTHRVLNYFIRLECSKPVPAKSRRFMGWGKSPEPSKQIADIAITDAAGGLLMGSDVGNQPREYVRLVDSFAEDVRQSRGVVYCLPIDSGDLDLAAERKQVAVIDDLVMSESIGLERLVLCLTKYEALWIDCGCAAFDEASDREQFAEVARSKIPKPLLMALNQLASRPAPSRTGRSLEVCVAPASAYGFIKNNGCVNFNPQTQRLLTESGRRLEPLPRSSVSVPYYEDPEAINYWEPFHIVDPFVYAAFGHVGDLMIDIRDIA